jgi:hypothetical protein
VAELLQPVKCGKRRVQDVIRHRLRQVQIKSRGHHASVICPALSHIRMASSVVPMMLACRNSDSKAG